MYSKNSTAILYQVQITFCPSTPMLYNTWKKLKRVKHRLIKQRIRSRPSIYRVRLLSFGPAPYPCAALCASSTAFQSTLSHHLSRYSSLPLIPWSIIQTCSHVFTQSNGVSGVPPRASSCVPSPDAGSPRKLRFWFDRLSDAVGAGSLFISTPCCRAKASG